MPDAAASNGELPVLAARVSSGPSGILVCLNGLSLQDHGLPTPKSRPRGRPLGGGNTADQAKTVLMDAAEHLFITRGYRASTMELIAHEAGYSRTAIYRQFANRRHLLEAMVQRTTQRYISSMQLPDRVGPVDLMVEGLIIVATELVHDPLLKTIAEQSPDGTVASLIAKDAGLTQLVQSTIETMIAEDTAAQFRSGLHPHDLAQFIIATALSLLLEIIPGITNPAIARRYIETFVLPAIVVHPPPPERVFPDTEAGASRAQPVV